MNIHFTGSGLPMAITLAVLWHGDQVDQSGAPYICHPLRLVLRAVESGKHPDVAIVAALHDVVEDTTAELATLRSLGFSDRVVDAIDALTRRDEESYAAFIRRAKSNQLGRIVKLLDVEDNADPTRLSKLEPETRARLSAKYDLAREILMEA